MSGLHREMLKGETLVVKHKGEILKIYISEVRDRKVKLSFTAPNTFRFDRESDISRILQAAIKDI